MELIPEKYKRAGTVPVGRLDKDTEGLLLLTNNGDIAQSLSKPVSHVVKEYYVELNKD
jgi:16S rRNA pseudouridine516 synthase